MDFLQDGEKRSQLIVLLPESVIGNQELYKKVYWLGIQGHHEILYLTLVDDYEKILAVRRSVATMSALTSDNSLPVNSMITETRSWLRTLKTIYLPGDVLVCHAEQSIKDGFFHLMPIEPFLKQTFHAKTIVLSGYYHPRRNLIKKSLQELVFWAGCLVLLGVFFELGIQLDHQTSGIARTVLGIAALAIEISAVWAWTVITRH